MIWFFTQEQWKSSSSTPNTKRKDRSAGDDEDGHGERKRRKGGKRRKKDRKSNYEQEEEEADMEEAEEADGYPHLGNDIADGVEKAQDHLLAAGLEDSDAENDTVRHLLYIMVFLPDGTCLYWQLTSWYVQKNLKFES